MGPISLDLADWRFEVDYVANPPSSVCLIGVESGVFPQVRTGGVEDSHGVAATATGRFAEYTLADATVLASVPDGLAPARVAAVPAAGMTAYQAVVQRLHLGGDDTVLITGGAGGVGGFARSWTAITFAVAGQTRWPPGRGR